MPGHPLEHLAAVPVEEGGLRLMLRPLGCPHALAVVAQQRLLEAGGAVGLSETSSTSAGLRVKAPRSLAGGGQSPDLPRLQNCA